MIGVIAFFLPSVMSIEDPESRPAYAEEPIAMPPSQDVEG
jgi:hypothetical protein